MLASENIYLKIILEAIKPPGGLSVEDAIDALGKKLGYTGKELKSFSKGLKTELEAALGATSKAADGASKAVKGLTDAEIAAIEAGMKLKEAHLGVKDAAVKAAIAEALLGSMATPFIKWGESAKTATKETLAAAMAMAELDKAVAKFEEGKKKIAAMAEPLKALAASGKYTAEEIKKIASAAGVSAEDLKKMGIASDDAGDKMHTMSLRGYFALSRLQWGLQNVRDVFAGAMKAVVGLAAEASDHIHQLEMDAARVGMAGSEFDKLQYAMERMGAKPGTALQALERFSQQIEEAATGSKAAQANFDKLGVSFYDAQGKTRPMLDILLDVADAMARIADPKLAEGIAKSLFGRGGGNIFAILRQGAFALQGMMGEGGRIGVGFSEEDLERATEFHRTLLDVKTSWRELKESLAVTVMPWLSEKLEMVKEWINSIREWTDEHRALAGALAEVALGFTAIATAIAGIGTFGLGVLIAYKALAVAAAEITATGGLFALAGGTAAVGGAVTAGVGAGAGAGAAATGAAGGLGLGAALGGAVALLTNPYIVAAAGSAAMFWLMYQETVGEALDEYRSKKGTEYEAVEEGMKRGMIPYREEVPGGWIRPEMIRGYKPSVALKEMEREQQEAGGWSKRSWMPLPFYQWLRGQGILEEQFHEMTPIEQERMVLGYAKAKEGLQGAAWMAAQLKGTKFGVEFAPGQRRPLTPQQMGWLEAQPLPPEWQAPETGGWGYGWKQQWTKMAEVEQWRQYYTGQGGGAASAGGDPMQAYMKWQRGVALSDQEKKQVANLINTQQMQLRQGQQVSGEWYQEQLGQWGEYRAQKTYQWQQFMEQVPEVDRPYYRQYQRQEMFQIGEEERRLRGQQREARTWVQGQLRLLNTKEAELEGTLYYGGGELAPGW